MYESIAAAGSPIDACASPIAERATALANEAYLRLVGQQKVWACSRAHFLAAAGQAMRRILID